MTPEKLTALMSQCTPGVFADPTASHRCLRPLLDAGFALVPLAPMSESKEPYGALVPHGVNDATSDTSVWDGWIDQAFQRRTDPTVPALGVGIRVGRVIVIDADTAEQAATADAFLQAMGYPAGSPTTVKTPGTIDGHHDGRGGHWYILTPDDFLIPSMRGGKLLLNPTINVTADGTLVSTEVSSGPGATCAIKLYGGYTCMPGTRRPAGDYACTGPVYGMTNELETFLLAAADAERGRRESVEAARATRRAAHRSEHSDAREGAREQLEAGGWAPVLSAAGWVETGGDRCGCATWRRPGGTSTRSATAHYLCPEQGGSTRLQVWTDALADQGLEQLQPYSMEHVAAQLHYGGDISKVYSQFGAPAVRRTPVDIDALTISSAADAPPGQSSTAVVSDLDALDDDDEAAPWNQVPATLDELTGDEAEVFNSTELTKTLWRIARGNGASPWALLGGVLLRTLGRVGPHVMLENLDGPYASLNMSALYIGTSGAGKSKIANTINTSVRFRQSSGNPASFAILPTRTLGTGEGIAQSYCGPTRKRNKLLDDAAQARGDTPPEDNKQLDQDRLLFHADEAANTEALGSRSGATLLSKIISAITGGDLGNTNGSEETSREVPSNSYRFCLEMNAQPSATGFLIEKSDLGLPQRFLWLDANGRRSMTRPSATERNLIADIYLPTELVTRVDPPSASGFHVPDARTARILVTFPDAVADYIWAQNTRRQHGCGDGQDSHRNLTRMKIAAGFAILDGARVTENRTVPTTMRHWELAGVLLEHSDGVRRQCAEAVHEHLVVEARVKLETVRDAESDLDAKRQAELTSEVLQHAGEAGAGGIQLTGRWENGGIAQKFASRSRKWKKDMCHELLPAMATSGLIVENAGRYYLPEFAPEPSVNPPSLQVVPLHAPILSLASN